jgi:hypothetical protein
MPNLLLWLKSARNIVKKVGTDNPENGRVLLKVTDCELKVREVEIAI